MNNIKLHVYLIMFVGIFLLSSNLIYAQVENLSNDNTIQPYHENPWYWQYKSEPILLIGGSADDNPW